MSAYQNGIVLVNAKHARTRTIFIISGYHVGIFFSGADFVTNAILIFRIAYSTVMFYEIVNSV